MEENEKEEEEEEEGKEEEEETENVRGKRNCSSCLIAAARSLTL